MDKKSSLLFSVFFNLNDEKNLLKTIYENSKKPNREIHIKGDLNEEFIYGINLQVFEINDMLAKEEKSKTQETQKE